MLKTFGWEKSMKCLKSDYNLTNYGLVRFSIEDEKIGRKYGYISREHGIVVVGPQFNEASDFVGSFAIVRTNEQYGVIDYLGRWVIDECYDAIYATCCENRFVVRIGGIYRIIEILIKRKDYHKNVLSYEFTGISFMDNGVSCIINLSNRKSVFFNLKTLKPFSAEYYSIRSLNPDNTLYVCKTDTGKEILTPEGKKLINEEVDDVNANNDDYGSVYFLTKHLSNNVTKKALLFENGDLFGWYDTIELISSNLYYLGSNDYKEGGMLNVCGTWFIKPKVSFFINGTDVVMKDGICRTIDVENAKFTSPSFTEMDNFKYEITRIKLLSGKYNYINKSGSLQFNVDFDEAYPFISKQVNNIGIVVGIVGRRLKSKFDKESKMVYACISDDGRLSSFKYENIEEIKEALKNGKIFEMFN